LLRTSHTFTVVSSLAEASRSPLASKLTAFTWPACPRRTAVQGKEPDEGVPERSHSRTVLSQLADASSFPSRPNATPATFAWCPEQVATSRRFSTSQRITAFVWSPVARSLPSQ